MKGIIVIAVDLAKNLFRSPGAAADRSVIDRPGSAQNLELIKTLTYGVEKVG